MLQVDSAAAIVHCAATQFCSCHFGTEEAETPQWIQRHSSAAVTLEQRKQRHRSGFSDTVLQLSLWNRGSRDTAVDSATQFCSCRFGTEEAETPQWIQRHNSAAVALEQRKQRHRSGCSYTVLQLSLWNTGSRDTAVDAVTQFCSGRFGTVAADTTLEAVASLVEATGNEW